MKIVETSGVHVDFVSLCTKLEEYQFNLLPALKEKGYSLIDDLDEVVGYILYLNNEPIGSIGLRKLSDETCEIIRVFVCEEYRGNGYAKLLFEKIESKARIMGFIKAEMVAWSKAESALKLYAKLGYKINNEQVSEWFGGYKYVEISKEL